MSRWFRHYAGMMRDDKLVRAALRAKQPIERVMWVWGAILESASEINDEGRYDFDATEASYFLHADEADIRAVVDALAALQRLGEDRVVNWGARQFQSDRSASRQAAYRERERSAKRNGDDHEAVSDGAVTATSRHGDAPDTDTDTDTEPETERKKEPTSLRSVGARAKNRGSLLPEDWTPSADDSSFSITAIGSQRTDTEIPKFRDYWHARAGPNAVKRDWSATWRNWIRKISESSPPQQQSRANNGKTSGSGSAITSAIDRHIERFEREASGDFEADEAPPRLLSHRRG